MKPKQERHSSRRLKDTLHEKILPNKIDLDRSRLPLAAAYKRKQILVGSALQLEVELGLCQIVDQCSTISSKRPSGKEVGFLNRKPSLFSC